VFAIYTYGVLISFFYIGSDVSILFISTKTKTEELVESWQMEYRYVFGA
jgi:hypothetical protein